MDIYARRSPPAVRARHRKYRLPYVDYGVAFPSIDVPGISLPPYPGVGADTGDSTTSTSTSTTPATTTTTNPAELPLHTSFLTSSSSTPSPTSTPAIVRTTATPSAPSVTPSASSDASNTTSNAVAKSKGIPGVAIGIIVAVILFIVMALIFFLIRRKYISNRQKKRATWAVTAFPRPDEFSSSEKPHDNAYDVNGAGASPAFGAGGAMSEVQTPAFNITPPPVSYNSVSPQSATMPSLSPGMGGASAAVGMSRAAATIPADAVIQCTFIPTLPDELSIRMGETVRVIAEYDDGWALCANAHDERGMVPLECLDQSAQGIVRQDQVDRRTSRRASSLLAVRY